MKIDVKKIEGFDTMSAEEKLNALLGYEIEEPKHDESAEITKYKTLISKANAEAAKYKDELRAKQTAPRTRGNCKRNCRITARRNVYRPTRQISWQPVSTRKRQASWQNHFPKGCRMNSLHRQSLSSKHRNRRFFPKQSTSSRHCPWVLPRRQTMQNRRRLQICVDISDSNNTTKGNSKLWQLLL